MTTYTIERTACLNPEINGRTLYLTSIGFWTLDVDHAHHYKTKAEAKVRCGTDGDLRIKEQVSK